MNIIALILAGGKGNRFWPKSSPSLPKQFLRIVGDATLFQETVKRVHSFLPYENIYVITGAVYKDIVREQTPQLPVQNLIFEPAGKDTAPAVCYAALWLAEMYPDAIMLTLPSDHYIGQEELWEETVLNACIAARKNWPVVIGIRPTRPESAYGYLIPGEKQPEMEAPTWKITKFIEKPNTAAALKMLEAGNCYWNSGMFVWKIPVVKKKLQKYLPQLYDDVYAMIQDARKAGYTPCQEVIPARLEKDFSLVKPISIDYGIMEKCDDLQMVPGFFLWDDVGGWQALDRLLEHDDNGNINVGKGFLVDTQDCIVDWEDGPVLIVGLRGAVIAGREGKLLVYAKKYLPQFKETLQGLKEELL